MKPEHGYYEPLLEESNGPIQSQTFENMENNDCTHCHQNTSHNRLSVRNIAMLLSSIINILVLALGLGLYLRRGPNNPLFPQALYCKAYLYK